MEDLFKLQWKLGSEEPDFKFKKLHPGAISPTFGLDNRTGWSLHAIDDYVFDMEDPIVVETGISISIGEGFEGIIGVVYAQNREDREPSFSPFAIGDEIIGFNRIVEAGKDTKLTIKFQNRFKNKDQCSIDEYLRMKSLGGTIRVEKGDVVATIKVQKIGLSEINEKAYESLQTIYLANPGLQIFEDRDFYAYDKSKPILQKIIYDK